MKKIFLLATVLVFCLIVTETVAASNTCNFTDTGSTYVLEGNCTTDETIVVLDGYTLNGSGYTITAIDPDGTHFTGPVVTNAGTVAHITHLNIDTYNLANVCDSDEKRLRGIMFDGASGSITYSKISKINQGASGCQEGNAIEVRNLPFDGEHPNTKFVEISHNDVQDYQKTGILANGDVSVKIQHNKIGASATQTNLAANSIQLGYGAFGSVMHNQVEGNQWLGDSDWAATAILIYESDNSEISKNNITGNSEIGIYNYGNNNVIDNNKVFDIGIDLANHGYDYGIGNWGEGSVITNNKVRGFETPYDNVLGGNNKTIPGSKPNSFGL